MKALRSQPWASVIKEPALFGECEIRPLLTAAALAQTGFVLGNCLDEHFADGCAAGKSHIFSVAHMAGTLLGALHLHFPVGRYGGYEVAVIDCKGPGNTPMSAQGKHAVDAFCALLKTAEGQRRIADLPRTRLELRKVEFDEQFEMELTIAALRQLRQKALRFDCLWEKIKDTLQQPGQTD